MSCESVQTAGESLKYVSVLLGQLHRIAKQHDVELAYFIGMAELHASDLCSGRVAPRPPTDSEDPYLSADLVRAAAI
ncbi:hypothetical protein KYK29_05175 [Shinella daejeonensis]|uniref:hypothetical protein n=1 Tax=Shinella daejeonensis TaxID=659017 RepID=UPI0020C78136|nr:hypothetical protein [Shinella daejeonensis]MCP8894313.1 hypothetical protein [Shinella daejeonensis]